jgi:hypothetical protein
MIAIRNTDPPNETPEQLARRVHVISFHHPTRRSTFAPRSLENVPGASGRAFLEGKTA